MKQYFSLPSTSASCFAALESLTEFTERSPHLQGTDVTQESHCRWKDILLYLVDIPSSTLSENPSGQDIPAIPCSNDLSVLERQAHGDQGMGTMVPQDARTMLPCLVAETRRFRSNGNVS